MASLLSKATNKVEQDPMKIVIYGTDGVGKTSFASGSDSPIFVGTEKSAARYGAHQTPEAKNLKDLEDTLLDLINQRGAGFKTVVLDAMDGIERLIEKAMCDRKKVNSIEDIGYGKGAVFFRDDFNAFMSLVDRLRSEAGLNVIVIAHEHVKKFNDPNQPAPYDRHQLKLDDKNAAHLKEWSDVVLFATEEVFVKTDKGKGKGFGDGKRIMYTERRPAYDAKNRLGLPHKMDLSWKAFSEAASRTDVEQIAGLRASCLTAAEQILDEDLKIKVIKTVNEAKDDLQYLRDISNRINVLLGG